MSASTATPNSSLIRRTPLQDSISLSPPGAIQGHQAGFGFHNLLSGYEGGLNKNVSVVLFGFPDSDDDNANGLPIRPDILRAVGADSCRPALHSGSGEASHCPRVAASRDSDAWNHKIRIRQSAQGICSSTPPVALLPRAEPVYVSRVEFG